MPSFMDRFSANPTALNLPRSTFDRSSRHKTSFNEGSLIPFYLDEVLPGDTFKVNTSSLVRLSNPAVRPVMDDMYLDVYYFFVPSRILWKLYPAVHGENNSSYWAPVSETVVPVEASTGNKVQLHSFYDYAGLPVGVDPAGLSVLPYAGYLKIWNDFFRDENLQSPSSTTDVIYNLASGGSTFTQGAFASSILSVSRYHDYFSSCLPAPQKGAAVTIPLGSSAPVTGSLTSGGVIFRNAGDSDLSSNSPLFSPASSLPAGGTSGTLQAGSSYLPFTASVGATLTGTADLSAATAANINALRLAFQTQKLLEKDARGGTRYTEMLKAHFGVINPDSRLQRPEFLGGSHTLLNMTQVQQTAPGTSSAVGSLGAYSLTGSRDGSFVKSFTEFGYVYGLACVRVKHSYSQGIPRLFTKKRRFDFYYPALANIGEQPVYQREIYGLAGLGNGNVFGFQEAWAEYRYKPDLVTGMLRPGQTVDMTAWTFGDNYSSAPTLNGTWVTESPNNINQTLAVPSDTADQFIADFGVYNQCTRVMPMFSVPGLIDHN